MLFNSFVFALVFLPVVLLGIALFGRMKDRRIAVAWLTLASLVYYGWWNPAYLVLIVGSIVANYAVGFWLRSASPSAGRVGLWLGVAGNLSLLGYYKYAGFFAANLLSLGLADSDFSFGAIALPLAISFFTFQQITYLVDSRRGETRDTGFLDYALFVTFFPQLIAGPIVHHKEMMPQFEQSRFRLNSLDLSVGLTFFLVGLFKKVVIADGIAEFSTPVFDAAVAAESMYWIDAWGGALGYTLQLYFDFSGYSDMAIGLARMFGIHLPWNFYSPYKAESAIEFWRRWHITLSRFLRDYVYIALGGNRHGDVRRYSNLLFTMLLGGLWHGAGWTFVFWGGMHGLYLVINHGFRALRMRFAPNLPSSIATRGIARAVTFIAIVFAWVLFRAESLPASMHIWSAMVGLGAEFPNRGFVVIDAAAFPMIAAALAIAWWAPNTQQWMANHRTGIDSYSHLPEGDETGSLAARLRWSPTVLWAVYTAVLGMAAFYRMMSAGYQEFLYRFF